MSRNTDKSYLSMNKKPIVKPEHRRVAKALVKGGKSLSEAYQGGGFSAAQGRKGWGVVMRSKPLMEAIKDEIDQWRKSAGNLPSPSERAEIARFRLLINTIHGEGDARGSTLAAKLLGQDKEVRLFEPEMSVTILNRPVPVGWEQSFSMEPRKRESTE